MAPPRFFRCVAPEAPPPVPAGRPRLLADPCSASIARLSLSRSSISNASMCSVGINGSYHMSIVSVSESLLLVIQLSNLELPCYTIEYGRAQHHQLPILLWEKPPGWHNPCFNDGRICSG